MSESDTIPVPRELLLSLHYAAVLGTEARHRAARLLDEHKPEPVPPKFWNLKREGYAGNNGSVSLTQWSRHLVSLQAGANRHLTGDELRSLYAEIGRFIDYRDAHDEWEAKR